MPTGDNDALERVADWLLMVGGIVLGLAVLALIIGLGAWLAPLSA